jgi:adenylate cyclase
MKLRLSIPSFSSVVDAVQCAVDVQQELTVRNADLPPHRRMAFRIGINLGDVIVEDERLYGDSVNIAARVEALAEAGGLCLSGTAYDQIDTKLALACVYLGEHTVKNIAKPVRVYRVLLHGETPRSPQRLTHRVERYGRLGLSVALALFFLVGGAFAAWHLPWHAPLATPLVMSDKPAIAVLPFVNLNNDPPQVPFSDGLTEELITALAKDDGLMVKARPAEFANEDKTTTIQRVGRELGVQYVVAGSIRTSGQTVRISAWLVNATTGYYLWAERYERVLTDIFVLQDEIIRQIVTALQEQLTAAEQACVA